MKHFISILSAIIICCFSSSMQAGTIDDALKLAKQYFQKYDADYFQKIDPYTNDYIIYVDAEPMKGWPHKCYLVSVNKFTDMLTDFNEYKYAPDGEYVALDVKNRYGAYSNIKPAVTKIASHINNPGAAQRTYALILSGGVNKNCNYERYWNDCSFIYQTLVNKYGVPKSNVFPIMADGANPAPDLKTPAGTFKSQSLDLDFDGINEISMAATKANVRTVLSNLSEIMKKDDQLFIYVMDHGGTLDNKNRSFINLWGAEELHDYELALYLAPFTNKFVNVNVVLGQCFAGGFIDDLQKAGCVVAAACQGNESSYSCRSLPYDEFVYHWTCAVNEADCRKFPVNSDVDKNGYVTMKEAFEYAKAMDAQSLEHPQYSSTPESVGEDLAFNKVVHAVDLYIQDNPEDTGKQPNLTTDKFWISPSIWIRNKADGIYEHENPYYTQDHVAVTVYVRVHNRGKQDYLGGTQYVHVFWAKASTGFNNDAWMGNETHTNGEVTGGPLTPTGIPRIPAGGYVDIPISWALPAHLLGSISDNGTEKHHFCLLAKILDTHKSPLYDGSFAYNCKESNKDAQKNVSIITRADISKGSDVFIRNVYGKNQKYSLELIPRTSVDEEFFKVARFEMTMSDPIYNGWSQGGFMSNEISRPTSDTPKTVYFTSKNSRLEAITLSQHRFDRVTMKVRFHQMPVTKKEYTLDLIQRDEAGNIIGGETFIVKLEAMIIKPPTPPVITPILKANGEVELSTDTDACEAIRWENNEGSIISERETVVVSPKHSDDNIYHVFTLTEDGNMSTASIELEPTIGIHSAVFDDMGSSMTIELLSEPIDTSYIIVTSLATGETMVKINPDGHDKIFRIDTDSWNGGMYAVSYMDEGMLLDNVKVIKK